MFYIRAYSQTSAQPTRSAQWIESPKRRSVAAAVDAFVAALESRHVRGGYAVRVQVMSAETKSPRLDLYRELLECAARHTRIRSVSNDSGAETFVEHCL